MYRIVADQEPILAMSVINPQRCRELNLQVQIVQGGEGPIPHVHVYLDKSLSSNNCAYVRLDRPEYSIHHKDGKHLSSAEKEKFLDIMNRLWRKQFTESIITGQFKPATGYQAAVEIWKDTYGETMPFEYDDEGYPLMPDYEQFL